MSSKKLAKEDATEVLFVKEALGDDPTFGVNVERLLNHPEMGWVLFEFLKLGGPFSDPPYKWRDRLDIHASHPNNYWHKNGRKFVSLWQLTKALDGVLFLVNYSVREAESEDGVPDDCIPQPYIRIPPGTDEEEKVYYYIAKDKGAHVIQVNDIDLSADFNDYDAEPIDTQPIPESGNGMDWDEFSTWFRKINRESSSDPRDLH
ncbi:hypothetical protein [Natronorubrum daqingense]|uniref:Uncharacterized protein n=1 Tax=Natronorubrum daqingense TaxID=588898 RepID=A0A1N7CE07_9EURY|nr:hypothetical protein [Natronorubrum daqingense]APX96858.1 hypothetical protein BB347_09630 [Natronorubrum daqingense]SIR61822.1 hypothetical protein SAMN05421809_1651 [Natronorubrum daqingense]